MAKSLSEFLAVAVPAQIEELEKVSGPTLDDFVGLGEFSSLLGEKGDILLFGGGKAGLQQQLADKLARAIAIMAYTPGGVRVFGQYFCKSES